MVSGDTYAVCDRCLWSVVIPMLCVTGVCGQW